MSKLYNKYLSLKENDPTNLYLFKSGIFYLFLDTDAQKMSPLLNLKLTKLNDSVVKCGFPVKNLDKYLSLIKSTGNKVNIIDSIKEEMHSSTNYITNSSIRNFIEQISNIDTENLSISQAYSFIDKIHNQAKNIVKEIEN